jgi:hypothetical protein
VIAWVPAARNTSSKLVTQGEDLGIATIAAEQQPTDTGRHQTHEPRQRRQHGRDRT